MIGWIGEVQGKTLVIYKLQIFKTGPEVTLSLTVLQDFTWEVSYRRHNVDCEYCTLLSNLPSEINTGKFLNNPCTYLVNHCSFKSKGCHRCIV